MSNSKDIGMTEAELVESISYQFESALTVLSLYVTVTSAYLVVVYLAGSKLTRSQIAIISTLYVFIAVVSTYCFWAWSIWGIHYGDVLRSLETGAPVFASRYIPGLFTFAMSSGILASLKFMWDIRHPKTE
jgi:hypothetical protein